MSSTEHIKIWSLYIPVRCTGLHSFFHEKLEPYLRKVHLRQNNIQRSPHAIGNPNIVCSCQQEDTGSVRLLNAAMVNGYSIVTYQRPLKAQDELDIDILTNGTQPVIWAIGPLNSKNEVSYHSITNKSALICHHICNAHVSLCPFQTLWFPHADW